MADGAGAAAGTVSDAEGLQAHLARRIREHGPLTVAEYMAEALTHPRWGYYNARQPFGTDGDFITAPEVSQMFGELLGAWCAHTWQTMGAPDRVRLVEMGPGRGALMRDLLRAAGAVPAFAAAAEVHLVEVSAALAETQRAALAGSGNAVRWHERLEDVDRGPALLIANEFFDALPVRQFQRTARGWCERLVNADADGGLRLVLAPTPGAAAALVPEEVRGAPLGTVAEVSPAAISLAAEIAARVAGDGGAALIIDWGAADFGTRETLQAVAHHKPHGVLDDPGSADLSAGADFTVLARSAQQAGAAVWGPVPQGEFLRALGIETRAAALRARASDAQRADLDAALERLVGTTGMGGMFRVLCIADAALARPAGFG